jgi:hypothetical protein
VASTFTVHSIPRQQSARGRGGRPMLLMSLTSSPPQNNFIVFPTDTNMGRWPDDNYVYMLQCIVLIGVECIVNNI